VPLSAEQRNYPGDSGTRHCIVAFISDANVYAVIPVFFIGPVVIPFGGDDRGPNPIVEFSGFIRTSALWVRFTITETDNGVDVAGSATLYPSLEVRQYSDTAPPQLVYSYNSALGPYLGPPSLLLGNGP
jgi:hypothetical protein